MCSIIVCEIWNEARDTTITERSGAPWNRFEIYAPKFNGRQGSTPSFISIGWQFPLHIARKHRDDFCCFSWHSVQHRSSHWQFRTKMSGLIRLRAVARATIPGLLNVSILKGIGGGKDEKRGRQKFGTSYITVECPFVGVSSSRDLMCILLWL